MRKIWPSEVSLADSGMEQSSSKVGLLGSEGNSELAAFFLWIALSTVLNRLAQPRASGDAVSRHHLDIRSAVLMVGVVWAASSRFSYILCTRKAVGSMKWL